MTEISTAELITKFWEQHPALDGWSIVTEYIPRPNNVNLSFKVIIRWGENVVVTAHSEGGTTLERAEDKAIARAISMLPPTSQSHPQKYQLNFGSSPLDS